MLIIGLTGSVGMGKSTVARMFARHGVPVHDADRAVHRHYRKGSEGYRRLAARFPEAAGEGFIDRKALGRLAFADPKVLADLEAILHPLVRKEEEAFLKRARRQRRRAVLLDIPLLFETGGEHRCDRVIVVSAPFFLQRRRVLARPGMTEKAFARILARQMPDRRKRLRADTVIPTGQGIAASERAVRRFLNRHLRAQAPCAEMSV